MEITVLFLARLQPGSGNNSTITRISGYFKDSSYKRIIVNTDSIENIAEFSNLLLKHKVDMVIGLHAYHAGKLLKGITQPYTLIFGGTDLNEYINDINKLDVMKEAVNNARFLVTFSEFMQQQAESIWPELENQKKMKLIPQGVMVDMLADSCISIHKHFNLPVHVDILVHVGAIRRVKDQLYLLDTFSAWHEKSTKAIVLAIVGPIMEENYGRQVLKRVSSCSGVMYFGGQSLQMTHSIIKESIALINSSSSEGQATAILEAQLLGTPVIARDIPGNAAIIKHGETGLLYNSPQDFIVQLERLLSDHELQRHLVSHAGNYVQATHASSVEQTSYSDLTIAMSKTGP